MKLQDLKSFHVEIDSTFEHVESILKSGQDSLITESMTVISAINLYNSIKALVKTVYDLSGRKNSLNDVTLRKIYTDELELLAGQLDKLPQKSKKIIEDFLAKHDIKMSGVDLSRKNINRIIAVKIIRFFIAAVENLLQSPVETVLNVMVAGLGTVVGAILGAKDGKGLLSEIVRSASQIKSIVQKAQG
jgi:hypothetical protein